MSYQGEHNTLTIERDQLATRNARLETTNAWLTGEDEREAWLTGSTKEALALVRPIAAERLRIVREGFEKGDHLPF